MRFHPPLVLFALLLLTAACATQQEPEQAALADRAGTDGEDAKTQELRKITEIDDAAERIRQLEGFIEANSGDPAATRAQSSLLRALAEEDPKRAVLLADQMLQEPAAAQAPSSRRNAMMFKFIANRNLKDEAAMAQMGAEILENETDPGFLQQAARFDEFHAGELMEKALEQRAKDKSPDTSPTLADLHSSYARTLSGKKEGAAALIHMEEAIRLTESRISELESSAEESDQHRLDRSRQGLNRMYHSMADICADAGQAKMGLQYLEMAEKAIGENDREQIPRIAGTRARLYEAMSDTAKALDSYIQAFAFHMSHETWQKIEALANQRGMALEEVRKRAREQRLTRATPFTPFRLKTLSGETVRFEDLQAKVTLVNFFFPT